MVEVDFRTILTDDAGVTALVPPTRINYVESPQGTPNPRIVYRFVSQDVDEQLDGESGWTDRRIQVDIWADDDASAVAVADAVETALTEFGGGLVGATLFHAAFRENARDWPQQPVRGADRSERRKTLDFLVQFQKG